MSTAVLVEFELDVRPNADDRTRIECDLNDEIPREGPNPSFSVNQIGLSETQVAACREHVNNVFCS